MIKFWRYKNICWVEKRLSALVKGNRLNGNERYTNHLNGILNGILQSSPTASRADAWILQEPPKSSVLRQRQLDK